LQLQVSQVLFNPTVMSDEGSYEEFFKDNEVALRVLQNAGIPLDESEHIATRKFGEILYV